MQKITSQIGQKKCLQLKKVKNIVLSTYVIGDLKVEVIVGAFYKKELQETNQLELKRVEKVIKRKGDNLYVKWKGYKLFWIVRFIKWHRINE